MLKTFATLVLAVSLSVFVVAPVLVALTPTEARADRTILSTMRPGVDGGTKATYVNPGLGGKMVVVDCEGHAARYLACKTDGGYWDAGGYNPDGGPPAQQVGTSDCDAGDNSARVFADTPTAICVAPYNNSLTLYRFNDGGYPVCNLYVEQPKLPACP